MHIFIQSGVQSGDVILDMSIYSAIRSVSWISFVYLLLYLFVIQPRLPSQKIPFKRAEKFIKEFRLKQKDSVRLSRQARRQQPADVASTEPKLITAIRIRR